jgi:rifampicin phosphotransferase
MAVDAASALVVDLARIDVSMLATVGGKAANLGEMIRAGMPVPPGLCVTTDAYRLVVADAMSATRAGGEARSRRSTSSIAGSHSAPRCVR